MVSHDLGATDPDPDHTDYTRTAAAARTHARIARKRKHKHETRFPGWLHAPQASIIIYAKNRCLGSLAGIIYITILLYYYVTILVYQYIST